MYGVVETLNNGSSSSSSASVLSPPLQQQHQIHQQQQQQQQLNQHNEGSSSSSKSGNMQILNSPDSPPTSPISINSMFMPLQLNSQIGQVDTSDPNWQSQKSTVRERNASMFNNELMADVTFIVGSDCK